MRNQIFISTLLLASACHVAGFAQAASMLSFDYQRAELRWEADHWQLWAGGVRLKDFGRYEGDAREALNLIRQLRLTERGTIGTPVPVMEYWLANGRAPQGTHLRFPSRRFDPDTLKAEQVQGQWVVGSSQYSLFNFGSHAEDAQKALAIILHYGFSEVVYVGVGKPVMIVFLAGPTQFAQTTVKQADSIRQQEPLKLELKPIAKPGLLGMKSPDPANPWTGHEDTIAQVARLEARQLGDGNPLLTPAGKQETVPFDWRQAEVRREQGTWKLMANGLVLGDFRADEAQARAALRLVRTYGFTERCQVGPPESPFTFYLVHGQAPRGLQFGAETVAFHAGELTVAHVGDDWLIRDGNDVLWRFGNHQEQAKQVLQLIQHLHFDHLCRLGSGTGGLTFMVCTR